jgi:chemotaxis protein MotB
MQELPLDASGNSASQIIIIKKKHAGHGAHHGGAWKVAYADFVTAMMALFIVLWLLSTSDQVKQAISGYFRDPHGHGKMVGSGVGGNGESLAVRRQDMGKLKDKIEDAVRSMPKFSQLKDNLQMTVTGEGLRLELLESEKGTFFESGNAKPTDAADELLKKVAEELGKLPNKVAIEGHTDSRPYSGGRNYSNWELSADRANAARRAMQTADGLRPDQVAQVRGYADQHLRMPDDPENPTNRRVTVIVQYQPPATSQK